MPSPAAIHGYKQYQNKIAEVERTLSSGDRNVLISEYNFALGTVLWLLPTGHYTFLSMKVLRIC